MLDEYTSHKYFIVRFLSTASPWSLSSRGFCTKTPISKLSDDVDFDTFESIRKQPEVFVIDVREPSELNDLGTVPGAVNIPLGQVIEPFSNLSVRNPCITYS